MEGERISKVIVATDKSLVTDAEHLPKQPCGRSTARGPPTVSEVHPTLTYSHSSLMLKMSQGGLEKELVKRDSVGDKVRPCANTKGSGRGLRVSRKEQRSGKALWRLLRNQLEKEMV